jgi:anaerobic selenocysteine-containing dehydrogenase
VRNGGAKLIIVNSREIRLRQHATQFIHIRPGAEDAALLSLADQAQNKLAATKMGVEASELAAMYKTLNETEGDIVVMFGGELSQAGQTIIAQLPYAFTTDARRVLLHPLPLYNNSVGAHDIGLMKSGKSAGQILDAAGEAVRALYIAGSFLPEHLSGRQDALSKLDFLVVQELFETDTTRFADVVFPAASFSETDGTFTNNDGFVQRVRQSIPPVHQAKQDWMITDQIARALEVDFNYQMSASNIFKEIAAKIPAYEGLRYPLLKDETQPVQVKHKIAERRDLLKEAEGLRLGVESMSETAEKMQGTPEVGHELFKPGTLTGKVPQFPLLAAGNPEPPTVLISPLYQITLDENLRRVEATAGD